MATGSLEGEIIARKSLGQHWLNDQASLDAIIESAEITPSDTVLEIGPGLGSLTTKLVEAAKTVVAVELDEQLAERLSKRITSPKLEVVSGNILKYDFSRLPKGYKVVANIPYYLTSNLLRILCENDNPFSVAALLVQKEVAERVCAKPGKCSLLSVSVQYYAEAELGTVVPAYLFEPEPKVDSQILRLRYRPESLYQGVDPKIFFRIVKAGFSQRRKTLLNSFSSGLNLSKNETNELLRNANIVPGTRAQVLSLDDWHRLYETYITSVNR